MKTVKYLFLAAAAMTLAACSNDENEIDNGPVEARISAAFGPVTRAVNTDNTWTASTDKIGIMVTHAPTSTTAMTDRYKNVEYTAQTSGESSNFSAETGKGIFFQDASETVTFAAYYPYQASTNAGTLPGTSHNGVVEVNTQNNNTAEKQVSIDFLFASDATASKGKPTVSFSSSNEFKHKMAQLKLVIKADTDHGFTDAEAADILGSADGTYKLGGLVHAGTFKVTDGTTDVTGNAVSEWDITKLACSDNKNTKTRTYTLILLPQDKNGASLTFTAKIGGQTYTNSATIAPKLEAGKQYTYTITLKKKGLTVSGCTIAEWETGGSGSGDAEM
ncbi:fimbrillin family protein [Bacteroides fluxus]